MAVSGILDNVDDDTADLILQLLQQDLDDVETTSKGKNRADRKDNASSAIELLQEDLKTARTFVFDRRMTKSIARAVDLDGLCVSRNARDEEIAHADHTYAERMMRGDERPGVGSQTEQVDLNTLSKLAGRYVSAAVGRKLRTTNENSIGQIEEASDTETLVGEPSAAAFGTGNASDRQDNHRCVACRDSKSYFDVIAAPCQHEYCQDCVREHFESSFTDESLFPPRCCRQPIPVESVDIFLTKQLKDEFAAKIVEFGTPNRTYCHQPDCGKFVPTPEIQDGVARCQACQNNTCTLCKGAAHTGTDCPQDASLQQVLELAIQTGWQRCFNCRRLVELELGCNHMTCYCGAEFCYVCGVRWKRCACDQWNEDRLVARAEQVVERDVPRMAANNPERVERVRQATQILRDRHNCDHTRRWRFIPGEHQCEECHHNLPQYIFECRQCRIRACNRCRRNRL